SSANSSPEVRREVENAFENDLTVMPFRIEDVRPNRSLQYYMGSVHWFDALTEPVELHIDALIPRVNAIITNDKSQSTSADLDQPSSSDAAASSNTTPTENTEKIKRHQKAAEQGNSNSQNELGVFYYYGRGVQQNFQEAIRWFRLAADQGHLVAMRNLGVC